MSPPRPNAKSVFLDQTAVGSAGCHEATRGLYTHFQVYCRFSYIVASGWEAFRMA